MFGHIFKRSSSTSTVPAHVAEFIAQRSNIECFDKFFNSKVYRKKKFSILKKTY